MVDQAHNLALKAERLMARRTEISRRVTSELPRNNFEKKKQPIGVPILSSSTVGRQGIEGNNSVVPRQTSGVRNRDVAKKPYNRPTSNKCYRCGDPGHNSSVCLARKPVHLANHEDNCVGDIEEDQGNDDLLDAKIAEEEGERVFYVVQRLLYTPKQKESSQRHRIAKHFSST